MLFRTKPGFVITGDSYNIVDLCSKTVKGSFVREQICSLFVFLKP